MQCHSQYLFLRTHTINYLFTVCQCECLIHYLIQCRYNANAMPLTTSFSLSTQFDCLIHYLIQYKYNTNAMPPTTQYLSLSTQFDCLIHYLIQCRYNANAMPLTTSFSLSTQFDCLIQHDNTMQIQCKCNATHYIFFFESTQFERPVNI